MINLTFEQIEKRLEELRLMIHSNVEEMEGATWDHYKELVDKNIPLHQETAKLIKAILEGEYLDS